MPPGRIPVSRNDLDAQIENLSTRLGKFGLGRYEARAYLSLIAHGYGTAETISETAKIPRTSAYSVLESLISKGFAIATEGRPRMYRPEPPARIRERFARELDEIFNRLEFVHEIVREKGMPQLIFTITGKDRVLAKIRELLETSSREFMISSPRMSEFASTMSKAFNGAIKRGVSIVMVTTPGQKVPKGISPVRLENIIATDVISDDRLALIAAPDLTACGYTEDRFLASHLRNFLMIAIAHARRPAGS